MRPAVVALALALLGSAALGPAARGAEEPPKSAPTVAMEAVALPIIVDGQLINYVFCSIRLDLAANADGSKVRAKEQFFRDDLVRAGHRTPYTRLDDYTHIDEAKVRAEIMRFAPTVVGPGVVRTITITRQVSLRMLTLPGVKQQRPREIVP